MLDYRSRQATIYRLLRQDDLPAAVEIERACYPQPLEAEDLLRLDRQKNVRAAVAEDCQGGDFRLIGHAWWELVGGKVYLLSLAVLPRHCRRGHGTRLFQRVLNELAHTEWDYLEATISDQHLEAQLFLRAMGMRAVKIVRNPLPGVGDAYVFRFSKDQVGAVSRDP